MYARAASLLTAILLLAGGRMAAGQVVIVSNANAGTLTITTAVAGSNPASVVRSTTTYRVTIPIGNAPARITAQLDIPMPAGTTMSITLAAPPGATSLGPIALSTVATDVVLDILEGTDQGGLAITYTFAATAAAGVVPPQTRTITFEIQ